jgi:hypothetical protein
VATQVPANPAIRRRLPGPLKTVVRAPRPEVVVLRVRSSAEQGGRLVSEGNQTSGEPLTSTACALARPRTRERIAGLSPVMLRRSSHREGSARGVGSSRVIRERASTVRQARRPIVPFQHSLSEYRTVSLAWGLRNSARRSALLLMLVRGGRERGHPARARLRPRAVVQQGQARSGGAQPGAFCRVVTNMSVDPSVMSVGPPGTGARPK